MAKEEKKVQNEQNINVDNIEETIRNGAVITEDVAKAAAEKIAKQRQEELTEKLIDVTIRTEYTRKRVLLSMKKTKKESEIKLNYLKKFSELHDKLKSGDKSLSIDEFEKKINEERQTAGKLLRENETWYDEQLNALSKQYPTCWSWRMNSMLI